MTDLEKVRLDKWLWASRFFKTRAQAKKAILNGKVLVNDERIKPSREIGVSANLSIKKDQQTWLVTVIALSERRAAAPIANKLYAETPQSIEQRELARLQRKSWHLAGNQRPTERERRQARQLREQLRTKPS